MRWGVKGDIITFAVEAQLPASVAYLGIGLSELGSMKGADIALFNATADGGWNLVDAYAEGFQPPVADRSQDLKLLGVQNTNGVLAGSWQRHLTPCDQQDLPIPATKTFVIWAHGSDWGYHGSNNRGSTQVSFLGDGSAVEKNVPTAMWSAADGPRKGLKVLEITYPVEIPAQETTYFVKYFKLPSDK